MRIFVEEFWAVTIAGDVLLVSAYNNSPPVIQKVIGRSDIHMRLEERMFGGEYLSVGKSLQYYTPRQGETRESGLRVGNFSGKVSAPIAAYFLHSQDLISSWMKEDLALCDERWKSFTQKTLQWIGSQHPRFYVTDHPLLRMPV